MFVATNQKAKNLCRDSHVRKAAELRADNGATSVMVDEGLVLLTGKRLVQYSREM